MALSKVKELVVRVSEEVLIHIHSGFFLGLSQMLVGSHSFVELLEMASEGDNKKVDIVSGDYPDLEKYMP
jgi:pantothenate kinase